MHTLLHTHGQTLPRNYISNQIVYNQIWALSCVLDQENGMPPILCTQTLLGLKKIKNNKKAKGEK
jgi:hypothetical protein